MRSPIQYARSIGVRVGRQCRFVSVNSVTFGSEPYLIKIGDSVEVSNEVCFLTHDGGAWLFRDEYPKLDVFDTIVIGNNVFIGRRATILPGTIIGDNCVIGAGSVVRGNLEANGVYAGVPARRIRSIDDYKERLLAASLECKRMPCSEKKSYLLKHFKVSD